MKLLLQHSLIYLVARGLPAFINFLAIAVYTRLLSPAEYGRYALVVAAVGLTSTVFFYWLNLSTLRFLPTFKTPTDLLSSIKGMYYLVAFVTGVVVILLVTLAPREWKPLLVVVLPLLWVQAWFDLNLEIARAKIEPLKYGVGAGIRALAALMLGAVIAYWQPVAYAPLTGLMIGTLAGGMWLARGQWWGVRSNLKRETVKQVLRYGLPLTVTFALSFVVSYSDRFILAHYLSEEAAGLYAAGYDMVSQTLIVTMMVVNIAAYPLAISALEQRGLEAAQTQLSQNLWLLLVTATPMATMLVVFSSEISSLILGKHFHEAAGAIVPWVSLAVLLSGVRSYYFDLAFQLGKCTVGQIWVVGIAAVTNVVLNFGWIPRWGLKGAAWATFAAYAVALLISIILGRKVFPIPISWKSVLQVAVATLAMVGAWRAMLSVPSAMTVLLQVAVMVMVYSCCVLLQLRYFRF